LTVRISAILRLLSGRYRSRSQFVVQAEWFLGHGDPGRVLRAIDAFFGLNRLVQTGRTNELTPASSGR
jgi:hypothetical protein